MSTSEVLTHDMDPRPRELQQALWSDTKEAVIREMGIHRHRAGDDARLLQLTYQRTLELAGPA